MAVENVKVEKTVKEVIEEVQNVQTQTIILRKPVKYAGKEYTEFSFDFDKLTGQDSLNIERELSSLNKSSVPSALNSEYLLRIAAKACTDSVGSDAFTTYMSLFDHLKVLKLARDFLLNGVL